MLVFLLHQVLLQENTEVVYSYSMTEGDSGHLDLGDDFRVVRGDAHKGTGHEGGSARPLQKPRNFDPRAVLQWIQDIGQHNKQKDKPGNN